MPARERKPTPKPKGTWGGRRPGAGAPKGNLNGLKHGLRSKQLAQLGLAFNNSPQAQAIFLRMAERRARKDASANRMFAELMAAILQRFNQLTAGELLDEADATDAHNDWLRNLARPAT